MPAQAQKGIHFVCCWVALLCCFAWWCVCYAGHCACKVLPLAGQFCMYMFMRLLSMCSVCTCTPLEVKAWNGDIEPILNIALRLASKELQVTVDAWCRTCTGTAQAPGCTCKLLYLQQCCTSECSCTCICWYCAVQWAWALVDGCVALSTANAVQCRCCQCLAHHVS